MASPSLQTIIVYKKYSQQIGARKGRPINRTRAQAKKIAEQFKFRSIYTSRETANSYRFRQRPPTDFVAGSFRTKRLPEFGVSLVYGKLKKEKEPKSKKNPGRPSDRDADLLRLWGDMVLDICKDIKEENIESLRVELVKLCRKIKSLKIKNDWVKQELKYYVVKCAEDLKLPEIQGLHPETTMDEKFELICSGPDTRQLLLIKNPKKHIRLKNPTVMPDPGPMSLLGETLEFAWRAGSVGSARKMAKKWKPGMPGVEEWKPKEKWLFLWSPKYKAVVAIKKPRATKKKGQVSREGGAAKISERFHARPAENTWEMEVPKVPLEPLGPAVHIVYRSDKWSETRETTDYIHDFNDGVQLYCGPSQKSPKVFICFGGKLTVTERGLVF